MRLNRQGASNRIQAARRGSGFTLIELMIVVGIVAILAALAIAGYGFAMEKARRSAAQGCLQEAAQFMERYYTTNMTYVGGVPPACSTDVTDFYAPDVPEFTAAATATTFTLRLRPEGAQVGDQCGAMTINQAGQKTAAQAGCW
jgi:type IV pilus assembly protein PilE